MVPVNKNLLDYYLFPVGLFFVAVTLFMINVNHEQLWCDEAYSVFASTGSFKEILFKVGFDGTEFHPPLYHLILGSLRAVFGESIIVLRGFSAVCGALLVVSVFVFTRNLYSIKTAIVTALLLLCNPVVVAYSQETMMYTMAAFLVAVNTFSFYYAFNLNKSHFWTVYIATGIAGLYTHYYFVFTFFNAALFVVYKYVRKECSFKKHQQLLFSYIRSQLVIGICFLPWLPAFWKQVHDTAAANWFEPVELMLPFKIVSYFFTSKFSYDVNPFIHCYFIAAFVLLVITYGTVIKGKMKSDDHVLYIITFVFPVLISCVVSLVTHSIIMFRYFILFFPFLLILFSLGLNRIQNKVVFSACMVLFLVVQSFSVAKIYTRNFNGSSRDMAEYLHENCGESEPAIVFDNTLFVPMYYYMKRSENLYMYIDSIYGNSFGVPVFRSSCINEATIRETVGNTDSYFFVFSSRTKPFAEWIGNRFPDFAVDSALTSPTFKFEHSWLRGRIVHYRRSAKNAQGD